MGGRDGGIGNHQKLGTDQVGLHQRANLIEQAATDVDVVGAIAKGNVDALNSGHKY